MAPAAKKALTLDDIWAAPDVEERDLHVPEWGGTVRIKALTKGESTEAQLKATVRGEVDPTKLSYLLLAYGMVEPKVTVEEAQRFKTKRAGTVERIALAVLELSGMTAEQLKAQDKTFRD